MLKLLPAVRVLEMQLLRRCRCQGGVFTCGWGADAEIWGWFAEWDDIVQGLSGACLLCGSSANNLAGSSL
jgi:hypothetical protein